MDVHQKVNQKGDAMSALEVGQKLPEFNMPASGETTVTNADYAGRKLVVFFYPRDDTSGCTKEAISFTGLGDEFAAAGAAILGVSKDSIAKHEKFITKHDLGVVLASDEHTKFCEDCGVWKEKSMYGKTYFGIERTTILVDETGVILNVWPKVKVPGHAEDVLQTVKNV